MANIVFIKMMEVFAMSNTILSGFRVFSPGAAPLIASLCRICQVQQTVDQMVQWRETARLTPGQIVEALIINILCDRRPLWKMEQFFYEIDLSLLYGKEITPDHLNDDILGRCLDKIAEIDLNKLVSQIGLQALLAHSLSLRVLHIDTTSISVEGEYANQSEDDKFLIDKGHSKDHRADLKQFKIGLASQEQGMICGGQLLSGHESDKSWNPQMIEDMFTFFQSKGQDGTIFVIDSAGISGKTLATWQEKKLKIISRFPETFNLATEVKLQAWQENIWNEIGKIAAGKDGSIYKSRSFLVEVEGTPVRLIVAHSTALEELKIHTLQKKVDKQGNKLEKEAKAVMKTSFACEADAQTALGAFLNAHKDSPYEISGQVIHQQKAKHGRRGRPKASEEPELISTYIVHLEIGRLIQERYDQLLQLESTFVLVTTLPESSHSDESVLCEYKNQNSIENRFRFIKQPAYLGPVYLKNPQRVKALGYVFILALMIGSYLEYRIRSAMEKENEVLILPGKKKVSQPSLNTMMEFFDTLKVARIRVGENIIRQWPENVDPQAIKLIRWAGFVPDIYLTGLSGNVA